MVAIGSNWTVAAVDFAATEIHGHGAAHGVELGAIVVVLDPSRLPARPIATGAVLTVLGPECLPDGASSERRVAFRNATDGKKYWALERAFQRACQPRR